MSNLLTATITIEGTKPILWNAFTLHAISAKKQEQPAGKAGNNPEEWKRTVLATPEGQLYVNRFYIFGCFRDGAKYTKQGRSSLQPMVVATLQVIEEMVLTDRFLPNGVNGLIDLPTDPNEPVYLDIRGVRNPATKARNIRYRVAASPGWRMNFQVVWDATLISRGQFQAVAIDAGNYCGLGDARQIGFGRFSVIQFEVQNWQ